MFTRRSGWAIVSAVILSLIAWNLDVPNSYLIVSVSVALLLVTFIHFIYSIGNFVVDRQIIKTAHEDDALEVELNLKNLTNQTKKFFELRDYFPAGPPGERIISLLIGKVMPKEYENLKYYSLCYKRGLYKIGPIEIIFQDFLGFFRLVKKLPLVSHLLVYPKVFNIKYFPELVQGSREWFGLETVRTSGESLEFYGIREYQRGDGLKRIHWKSTARLGNLTVRQYEKSITSEATIILDLKRGHNIGYEKDTTLEYAVKIAASISRYLLLEHQSLVQIIGYGKDFVISPFNKGDFGYFSIMEYLAQVNSDGDTDMAGVLAEASYAIGQNSTLITFLLDKDDAAFEALSQFKAKGIEVILFVFNTDSFFETENKEYGQPQIYPGLMSLGATVYSISKGDNLQAKFEVPMEAK